MSYNYNMSKRCMGLCVMSTGYNPTPNFVPLKSTKVVANLHDLFSMVTVEQQYVNESKTPIETEYLFPTNESTGIMTLSATFGSGKELVGVHKKKDEARKEYNTAVADKKKACILEKFDNYCKTTVGNLEPDETVTIKLTYIDRSEPTKYFSDSAFKFVFATNIFPKYSSSQHSTKDELDHPVNNVTHSSNVKYDFDFVLNCTSKNVIKMVCSASHKETMEVTRKSDFEWTATTKVLPSQGDLNVFVVTEVKPTVCYTEDEKYVYCMLMHQIPDIESDNKNAEYIVMLDRSGSMEGEKMSHSLKALEKFVDALPFNSKMNVLSFGSTHEFMWNSSLVMNKENKHKCIETFSDYTASLGGTELFEPVKKILSMKLDDDMSERNVILISDGEVSNANSIFDLIKKQNTQNFRFFTIGVGSSVDRHLINGIAKCGYGTSVFVNDNSIDECITEIFKRSTKSYYKNVKVDWKTTKCVTTGNQNTVVYPNKPFVTFTRITKEDFVQIPTIHVTATEGKKSDDLSWDLSVDASSHNDLVKVHFYQSLITDIENNNSYYDGSGMKRDEIVELAVQYSIENKLVSNYVSLILKDTEQIKNEEKMQKIKVPHHSSQSGTVVSQFAEKTMNKSGSLSISDDVLEDHCDIFEECGNDGFSGYFGSRGGREVLVNKSCELQQQSQQFFKSKSPSRGRSCGAPPPAPVPASGSCLTLGTGSSTASASGFMNKIGNFLSGSSLRSDTRQDTRSTDVNSELTSLYLGSGKFDTSKFSNELQSKLKLSKYNTAIETYFAIYAYILSNKSLIEPYMTNYDSLLKDTKTYLKDLILTANTPISLTDEQANLLK